MATKKEETVSLIDTFQEFKELKNIDRMTLVSVLEESFRSVISKMFGTDENYSVIVNPDKGDCEIQRSRIVVEDKDLEDSNTQISLTEARQIDEDFEVGEEVSEQVDFSKFGRRAILNLRQTLASKILELEKDSLYNKYVEKIGTIVTGEVYQIWKKEILLLDEEGNELLLAKTDQIPSDFFRKGETVRAVVDRVDNVNNPKIMLSRTSPVFLQRLLEQEVPEIADGLITIKKIVRIPGERAKIAVESYDDRIDPVGACVGVKGSRIHGIVRELRNENIDVINYTTNIELFIKRALSPAKISELNLDTEARRAEVYLKQDQVSLAIGKSGLNIKLASMLTEYTIDVYRELEQEQSEEDIYLDDFRGDIEDWVVDALHDAGFETAKAVLRADREILTESVDLEEEQVDEILDILAREFADEEEFQKFIKK
ncbi:MAG: transcription termination/antitermination protein NusA [Bacteroidaceae bacterium]|jgi:N utilization substance protein A|nr:transcription termination/antitermination protein NusA [Bacteroidaceae bacterium]MBR3936698.1 transcription termination/antitermination protein NusA [Bacteroidaceae bacterium]